MANANEAKLKMDSPYERTNDEPVEREEKAEEDGDEQGREDVTVEDVDGEKFEDSATTGRQHCQGF